MHQFFGILVRQPSRHEDLHRQSIGNIKSRFPSRSASFEFLRSSGLTLFGTSMRKARIANLEIFLLGEIYNEVDILKATPNTPTVEQALLHQYLKSGDAAISTVNGSFVVIMLNHEAYVCRIFGDQMGAMQCFFYAGTDYLLFASELKFLFCHPGCPKELDWTSSLKRPIPFLVVNSERHQEAWFKNIKLLEEGSILEWQPNGKHSIRCYWDPWKVEPGSIANHTSLKNQVEEYAETYMALLDDAVRIRCSTAGSTCSMFSGGMDSTIIATLARKHSDVETISFATPATLRDGATEMGLRLAQDLRMPNTQILVPFDDLTTDGDLWMRHIWSMESPYAHKDAIGKVALHAALSNTHPVDHLLSGTGSDQLNGGLVRWFVENAEDASPDQNWDRVMSELRTEMLKPVIGHQYDTFWGSRDLLRHDYLASCSMNGLEEYPWNNFLRGCLHANHFILVWDELRSGAWFNRGVRFPFMDYRFVPFVLNVPRHLHGQLFFDKQILRAGSRSLLPEYLTHRPKAPVIKPGEDIRHHMNREILLGHNGRVLDALLDSMKKGNCPVDPVLFELKVRQLSKVPDLAGWAYVMHLAGLVMLSHLPDQDEHTSNMHDHIMAHVDIVPSCLPHHIHLLRERLSVPAPEDILQLPIQYSPGCSLVSDVFSHAYFLVRDGELCYQLDDELPAWASFLRAVDGYKSAYVICAEQHIDPASISEFLHISLEEGILSTLKTALHHGTN